MNENTTVKEIMARPVAIAKSATIVEALEKMLAEGIDPLLVTANSKVTGTISRRAIAEVLGSRKNAALAPTKIHVASYVDDNFTSVYPDQPVDILVPLLQHHKLVAVFDPNHHLIGQVGYGDLLKVLRPQGKLDGILERAYTIQSEERVVHLRRRMLDEKIRRFVVTDNGSIVGMVTETDVARSLAAFREVVDTKYQDQRIRNLIVRDIMKAPVIAAERTVPLSDAVDLMLKKQISALPVTEQGRLLGILTRESLIRAL
ncbi:MAG: CBS domain-containing protein [Methanomicrobiales archaeon]|nr:CBS domain-containing protein [Methanomicrobiales archaeon]